MATLGKPSGTFRLDDSDNHVGSYIRREDVKSILQIDDEALGEISFQARDGEEVIDENVLHKKWKELAKKGKVLGDLSKASLNELIVAEVCRRAIPGAKVEHQVEVLNQRTRRKNRLDLRLSVPGFEPLFIEFDGPYHFIPFRPGQMVNDPWQRKRDIEDATQMEVVNWPYWIHECETNVRALFNPEIKGFGSLWSTNIHFGDFVIDNPADVIEKMSSRFNAGGSEGYGYLYEGNPRGVIKPEHPVIKKILDGKEQVERIIPKNAADPERWIPKQLLKV
ncbi:hypothetical protein ACT3R5_11820 [Glutamicibacter sp. AOP5-A2-7]